MTDAKRDDPLRVACELVGRFQYHFSKIEKALDAGIAKVFSLNDGASTVLVANIDFKKKVDVIKAMATLQFRDDGSLDKLLSEILGINSPHRQTVIHSTFEPHDAGAVKFERVTTNSGKLKVDNSIWTAEDFAKHFSMMERVAADLNKVIAELKPYEPSLDFSDARNSTYITLLF
jgi:hypothetical protein